MLHTLNNLIRRKSMPARVLLSKLCYADPGTLQSNEYQDSRYLPAYYHLGKTTKAKKVLNIGFNLGMTLGSYLFGARSCKMVVAIHEPDNAFYTKRLGVHNIFAVYKGKFELLECTFRDFNSVSHEWDLVIIEGERPTETQVQVMSEVWGQTGLMCIDRLDKNKQAVEEFTINRKLLPVVVQSRYGMAIYSRHSSQQHSQNSATHSTVQESDLTSAKRTNPFLVGTAPTVVTSAPQT